MAFTRMKRVRGLHQAKVWCEFLDEIELWIETKDHFRKLKVEEAESQGFIHVEEKQIGLGGSKYVNYVITLRSNVVRVVVNPKK